MRKLLVILCLFGLVVLPSLAQGEKLAKPEFNRIFAVDYSTNDSQEGWCIMLKWDVVPGAQIYYYKIWGKKKNWTPYEVDGSRERAAWTRIWSNTNDPEEKVAICDWAENQKVILRIRGATTIDGLTLDQYGRTSQKVVIKLPKYGTVPYSPRTGYPTLSVLNFSIN